MSKQNLKKSIKRILPITSILCLLLIFIPYKTEAKGFGTDTEYGECQWTGCCGESSSGTRIVTEKFKVFWITVSKESYVESCTPSNSPC
ncbi:hypothetical protein [Elizabethkingia meningoseptica]|uniref:hypothetical protein n=1 Tax=Elizabethkingia meningoseptica TaxID=238 RepID=UPI002011252F|nr:hypothetical protein [Elizabethkingia meningoseptica]MCL1673967.1 hypothetical protein [Elizabethkingia meningoseptica]MCL1685392.1 hypothetical protein [Elizabethkingia meningoseptica]